MPNPWVSGAFKNAVSNTPPGVIRGEFNFNSEFSDNDVGEHIRMRIKIHLDAVFFEEALEDFSYAIFELIGFLKSFTGALGCEGRAKRIKYFFKFVGVQSF